MQATSVALQAYRENVRLFNSLVLFVGARLSPMSCALLVAASGNESNRNQTPSYTIAVAPPAAADGIIAVAALQSPGAPHEALTVASFSNTNAIVAAPGASISRLALEVGIAASWHEYG